MYVSFTDVENSMDYVTTSAMAEQWNISRRRVTRLCQDGRIEGAILRGNVWLVPDTAQKPARLRKSNTHPSMEQSDTQT